MTQTTDRVPLPKPRQTKYGVLRAAPVECDRELPASAEVVIIGGGIMGVATAYFLAKKNVPVVLCEKGEIACESSSRAFGWVSELMLDAVKQPMTQLGKRLWGELQEEIGELGFRRHGLINLAETEAELGVFADWVKHAEGTISADTRLLTSAEVAARLPTLTHKMAGGLFCSSDGGAEPTIATSRLADAARRLGARIIDNCAVRGLDLEGGRVVGVFTEKGRVKAPTVICAANTWSRLFCGNHGVDVPQIYAILSMGSSTPTDGPIGAGGTNGWAWRRQIDGGYSLGGIVGVKAPFTRDLMKLGKQFMPLMQMMGGGAPDFGRDAWNDFRLARRWRPDKASPFEKLRVLSGSCNAAIAPGSLNQNAAAFPEMAGASVAETWSGPLTITPDNKPIIGPVDAIPGFHLITGTSYGIGWGPAVGKVMAETVTGASPSLDLAPFNLRRFSDGSPLVIAH